VFRRGLVRERLTARFGDLWARRLGLVVAPAGWGKTTLLDHVAGLTGAPVVWLAAEDAGHDGGEMLAQLERAVAPVTGIVAPSEGLSDLAEAIDSAPCERMLLVVDNLHEIAGSESEQLLQRFVQAAPPKLAVLVASRSVPAWNLSRRRVSGELVELSRDDLRFRWWEVERLFRDHYGSSIGPDDLAALSRLTEGWAAALQLFHLATHDQPAPVRRRIVASLGPGFHLMREYLVQNVLDQLPAELREFLVATCVLGRLRGPMCDELRTTTGSHVLLEELERRQLVTFFVDGSPWYRCHEVLRAHLETAYLETVRQEEARPRYLWAASLLEAAGAVADALRAYCRAEDWEEAARLLGRKGQELSQSPGSWSELLPPSLVRHDPWFLLSEARRHRADGGWADAIATYQQAQRAMPVAAGAEVCRRERATLAAWLQPDPVPVSDWLGVLRTALERDPMSIHRRESVSTDPRRLLVAGLAALAAGAPAAALGPLAAASGRSDASPALAAVADLAAAAAAVLGGTGAGDVERAAEQLEVLRLGALMRFVAPLTRLASPEGRRHTADLRLARSAACDRWSASAAGLLEGWAALSFADGGAAAATAIGPLHAAAGEFQRLGVPVLAILASSLGALAAVRAGDAGARAAARRAEVGSRAIGSPGAQAIATLALAECGGAGAARLHGEAQALARSVGLALPGATRRGSAKAAERPDPSSGASVSIRCFRRFTLAVRGEGVDLSVLKPRARRVLRILATHCPDWVHREMLIDAVWPDADRQTGTRNLQVVISSLRHVLEPEAARGGTLLVRQGEAYRLAIPPDGWVDRLEFERAVAAGNTALRTGDRAAVRSALNAALELATGPFLPEDGPDDWVVAKREQYRAEACRAAETLAGILVEAGDHEAAAAVCERGLAVDRCSDRLWRLLAGAHETAGDVAAAARARQEYRAVLAELGLPAASQVSRPPFNRGK